MLPSIKEAIRAGKPKQMKLLEATKIFSSPLINSLNFVSEMRLVTIDTLMRSPCCLCVYVSPISTSEMINQYL
jgi:hypothetical protein